MDIAAVKEMIEKSKPILGYDILEICLNGPEDKLEETRYCQPAMFLGGLAGLEKLKQDKPEAREGRSEARAISEKCLCLGASGRVTSIRDGRPLPRRPRGFPLPSLLPSPLLSRCSLPLLSRL